MSLRSHKLALSSGRFVELGTLAQLGVTRAVVTLTAQGDDTMELTIPRSVDATALFTTFSRYTLLDPAGETRFIGWLTEPPRSASANSEFHTYRFRGPWTVFFTRTTYKQKAMFAVDPTLYGSAIAPKWISKVILNYAVGTGKISVREQLQAALLYALAKASGQDPEAGAPLIVPTGPVFNYNADQVPEIMPPEDEQTDRTIADVIRGQLRWTPGVSCRWNYRTQGSGPFLEFIANYDVKLLNILAGNVTGFDGAPRPDLLVPEVKITYIREELALEATDDPLPKTKFWRSVTTDVSRASNGAFGAVEFTIELRPKATTQTSYESDASNVPEDPPVGLAASLHEAFKELTYDLSWTITGDEVSWADRPAEKWNVKGAGAGFDNARSICQSIVRDIGTGTTTYTCGAAAHLGLADMLALLRPFRRRNPSMSQAAAESGLVQKEKLYVCDGGVNKTVSVRSS